MHKTALLFKYNFEDMNTACLLDCDGILFLVNNYSENSSMAHRKPVNIFSFFKNQEFTRKTLNLTQNFQTLSVKYLKLC
jgi:hypothetical protein